MSLDAVSSLFSRIFLEFIACYTQSLLHLSKTGQNRLLHGNLAKIQARHTNFPAYLPNLEALHPRIQEIPAHIPPLIGQLSTPAASRRILCKCIRTRQKFTLSHTHSIEFAFAVRFHFDSNWSSSRMCPDKSDERILIEKQIRNSQI